MPIGLTEIDQGELCQGSSWTIRNQRRMAEILALVALGQSKHASKIMAQCQELTESRTPDISEIKQAKQLLTVGTHGDCSLRDGWIFQIISWVAAHCANPAAIRQSPHMQHADKGFDGLQLEFLEKDLISVIIFEDKATTNPRKMITSDVWPGFKDVEKGLRNSELVSKVTDLLEKAKLSDDEITAIVNSVIWKDLLCYRVGISVNDKHSTLDGHKKLFKGFSTTVKGGSNRRRGDICHFIDLRQWMRDIAEEAKDILSSKVSQ